jgi:hypothetical protein
MGGELGAAGDDLATKAPEWDSIVFNQVIRGSPGDAQKVGNRLCAIEQIGSIRHVVCSFLVLVFPPVFPKGASGGVGETQAFLRLSGYGRERGRKAKKEASREASSLV